jgi:hypothetical protein
LNEAPEQKIAARLRHQALACEQLGSPLYANLLNHAATDVVGHGPTWKILQGHEDDPAPSALALRLMGAVNRLVLAGEERDLAAAYEGDDGSAWPLFKWAMERNVERLRELVQLPVQTNEVGRCAALLPGFLTVALETEMPLRLLEIGASAGLNLCWDRYRYISGDFDSGAPDSPLTIEFELRGQVPAPDVVEIAIAERRGCDLAPIDPLTAEGRVSLLAYVWPDQPARIERLRSALDIRAEVPISIDQGGAASWAEEILAQRSPGRATVHYHSIVMQYLSEQEREAFERHVREAGERASEDAPFAWLRMEPAGAMADVRITTWPKGEERHLARVGYHGNPVELIPG